MLSPIPRRNRGVHISLSSPTMAAFPDFWAGRLPHCVFRGLLSVHSRYGLHTCQVTYMTLYTGGFSRFVASAAAPIATGWSDLAGRDSHPLRNRAFARRTKNRTFRSLRKPIAFLKPIAIRFCSLNYWAFDRFEDRCINLPLLRQAGFLSIWVISGPSDCNGFRLCQLEREVD
jgi:hypothetical protein